LALAPGAVAHHPHRSKNGRPYLYSAIRLRSVMISSGRSVLAATSSTVAVRSRERK